MSENQFQAQPRPQNAFDNKKLRISGKNEAGKMCFMAVSLINNNPRLSIYTNIDGDKDNGRIVGAFDTLGFGAFLELIKRAIESTTEVRWKIELMRPNFKAGGGRPDGYVTASEVWVGQDKDGMIWVCLTAYNRPSVKCILTNNEYHKFVHSTGESFSPSEASKLWAKSYYNTLTGMLPAMQVAHFVEEKKRDGGNQRQGGGGGGFQRGGNGGGYNSNRGQGGGGTYDRTSGGGGRSGGSSFEVADTEEDALPF